ncbi:hypothetical protein GQ42DRAFT_179069 [Ramicandelaber brevisporus]|nr:hypothetical protein GQ42DRAFT_179069 [Ramicandelaber brevisporus]
MEAMEAMALEQPSAQHVVMFALLDDIVAYFMLPELVEFLVVSRTWYASCIRRLYRSLDSEVIGHFAQQTRQANSQQQQQQQPHSHSQLAPMLISARMFTPRTHALFPMIQRSPPSTDVYPGTLLDWFGVFVRFLRWELSSPKDAVALLHAIRHCSHLQVLRIRCCLNTAISGFRVHVQPLAGQTQSSEQSLLQAIVQLTGHSLIGIELEDAGDVNNDDITALAQLSQLQLLSFRTVTSVNAEHLISLCKGSGSAGSGAFSRLRNLELSPYISSHTSLLSALAHGASPDHRFGVLTSSSPPLPLLPRLRRLCLDVGVADDAGQALLASMDLPAVEELHIVAHKACDPAPPPFTVPSSPMPIAVAAAVARNDGTSGYHLGVDEQWMRTHPVRRATHTRLGSYRMSSACQMSLRQLLLPVDIPSDITSIFLRLRDFPNLSVLQVNIDDCSAISLIASSCPNVVFLVLFVALRCTPRYSSDANFSCNTSLCCIATDMTKLQRLFITPRGSFVAIARFLQTCASVKSVCSKGGINIRVRTYALDQPTASEQMQIIEAIGQRAAKVLCDPQILGQVWSFPTMAMLNSNGSSGITRQLQVDDTIDAMRHLRFGNQRSLRMSQIYDIISLAKNLHILAFAGAVIVDRDIMGRPGSMVMISPFEVISHLGQVFPHIAPLSYS